MKKSKIRLGADLWFVMAAGASVSHLGWDINFTRVPKEKPSGFDLHFPLAKDELSLEFVVWSCPPARMKVQLNPPHPHFHHRHSSHSYSSPFWTPHWRGHAWCFSASQMPTLCHLLNENKTKCIENKICGSRMWTEEEERLCIRMCKKTSQQR